MTDIETTLRNAALDLPAETPELSGRAETEGLLDVAYTSVDSPLGPLVVAATPKGSCGSPTRSSAARTRCSRSWPGACRRACSRRPRGWTPCAASSTSTSRGAGRTSTSPIDWSYLAGFTREVLRATARIGFGEVSTYAGVAAEAGSPRAVRAAGNALGSNPMPVVVPCHRVLRTGGTLGGYTGGLEKKEFLLRLEGALL